MNYDQARNFLVISSILILLAIGIFSIMSPITKYPLKFDQSIQIIQTIFPLFLGYLSSAMVFITSDSFRVSKKKVPKLMQIIIYGVSILFSLLLIFTFISFGISNWPSEQVRILNFTFDSLMILISSFLGIHAATTSGIVAYLFKIGE